MDRDYELELYDRLNKVTLALGHCIGVMEGMMLNDGVVKKETLAKVIADVKASLNRPTHTHTSHIRDPKDF